MSPRPTSHTIPALLDEQARLHGQRLALVSGTERISYAELRARARSAARGLAALGVRRGDHVAILMGNQSEWLAAFLGIELLGAVAVAVNTWATARELEHVLTTADVSTLISADRMRKLDFCGLLKDLAPLAERCPQLKRIVWVGAAGTAINAPGVAQHHWSELATRGATFSESELDAAGAAVGPEDDVLILFTSGSTAQPKAIVLQQGSWIENAFNIGERMHVTADDRLWLAVSLFWSYGCVNAFPNLFSHAGCIVLQEQFDAAEALELIERERCTLIYGTPNIVGALLEHPDRTRRDLRSLRSGALIGTPEQMQLAVDLGAREICNIYGLSETYGNCAVADASLPLAVRLSSVGQPLPGVTVRICDGETGAVLPVGKTGEIRVKGHVLREYYKDPEKTAESFDAEGWFRTGDLGNLDEAGLLYFRGRLKEMIKSGGINIAPAEVEEILMRHPAVHTAYVIGLPDPVLDEAMAAVIIPRPGATPDPDDLKKHCRAALAAYKVPQHWRIARLDELPLTTTSKVQKMRLKELFGQG